jgi:transposase-like protein
MTNTQNVGIQNFGFIYEEQMMAHIQNHTIMTLNLKNFTIFPIILREIDAEKTHFQPAKTQKKTISQDDRIKNVEFIYEEKMMAPIQNHTKHDFQT